MPRAEAQEACRVRRSPIHWSTDCTVQQGRHHTASPIGMRQFYAEPISLTRFFARFSRWRLWPPPDRMNESISDNSKSGSLN